jgi:hypothetical protein
VATVQRLGAVLVAVVLVAFGLLGFLERLDYFSTEGGRIAGQSSDRLLSAISVVTAVVLVVAALRSARTRTTPRPATSKGPEPERYASTPAERAVERAMRAAELAVSEHRATPEQARRVAAMAAVRTRADRRRVWVECEGTAIG